MAGMIPLGKPEFASDPTTAALLRKRGSQSQSAVDERIAPVVADAVASDASVTGAAAVAAERAVRPALDAVLGGTRRARVALTLPGGGTFRDARESVTQRLPILLPASSLQWRIHMRNANYRDTSTVAGELAMRGFWFGRNTLSAAGDVTGTWAGAPTQIVPAFSHSGSAGEFISSWITDPALQIQGGVEHLLGYGYTGPAQQNHQGLAGGWTTNSAADVESMTATLTEAQFAPLDIWLEIEVASSVPIVCAFGDSIAVGTASRFPIRDSTYQKLALANGAMPMLYAHHGSTMDAWNQPTQAKWTTWLGDVSKPDVVLWQLGSNDIFNGEDLPTCKSRFTALLPTVRDKLSPNISLVTITPRNGSATTPAKEAVRVAYNDWLLTLPGGAKVVYDVAERVESRSMPGTMDARFISVDNVHPNSAGYARAVTAFGAIATPPASAYDPRVPLHTLPVAGVAARWVSSRLLGFEGEGVTAWADEITKIIAVPGVGWSVPVLRRDIGGRRSVKVPTNGGLTTDLARGQGHTVFVVARVDALPSSSGVLIGGNAAAGERASLFINSTGKVVVNAGSSLSSAGSITLGKTTVFTGVFDGANSAVGINGTETAGNAGAESAPTTRIGRLSSIGTSVDGVIFEVLIYLSVLTPSQRESITTVLKAVYGA